MIIGMVGLGKMGSNMVRRLIRGGITCVVYDHNQSIVTALEKEGAISATSLQELPSVINKNSVKVSSQPTVVWSMLPSGTVTEETVELLSHLLKTGDIIVDGGNSHFKDDILRADFLQAKGIRYLDVGVSGGIWGLERGYSLMIGGDLEAAQIMRPIFQALAPGLKSVEITQGRSPEVEIRASSHRTADHGFVYCGKAGAGHFVKMVHNGIEYGMMESFAEGFDILKTSNFSLNLTEIAEVWRRGSVVASWLLDLIAISLNQDPELSQFSGKVPDSGEGRWTIEAAIEQGVPAEVLASALFRRFRSRETQSYAEKLLSAMRHEFGGHTEASKAESSKEVAG